MGGPANPEFPLESTPEGSSVPDGSIIFNDPTVPIGPLSYADQLAIRQLEELDRRDQRRGRRKDAGLMIRLMMAAGFICAGLLGAKGVFGSSAMVLGVGVVGAAVTLLRMRKG